MTVVVGKDGEGVCQRRNIVDENIEDENVVDKKQNIIDENIFPT